MILAIIPIAPPLLVIAPAMKPINPPTMIDQIINHPPFYVFIYFYDYYFNIQINSGTQTQTGSIPVTLTASGDGAVVPAGTVTYNPHQVTGVQLIKGGWMDSGNKTIGHYKIAINQANKEMVNAKVTDTLLNAGVQYIEDSFQILEGKWVSNETISKYLFKQFKDY